jgi:hypothetical protein
MFTVSAQFNTFDSCPKSELRAWDYESAEFHTLSACIAWLIEQAKSEGEDLVGFTIRNDEGDVVAEHIARYYPIALGGIH